MIKKLIFLVILAGVLRTTGLLPFRSSDVAELIPVQALVVSQSGDNVVLDGGQCRGIGSDWDSAWNDLKESAEGRVFLQTADHVILCGEAVSLLQQVLESGAFRPAASVCVCTDFVPDAEQAAAYLGAHNSKTTLQQVQALRLRGGKLSLPRLRQTEGGLRLDER